MQKKFSSVNLVLCIIKTKKAAFRLFYVFSTFDHVVNSLNNGDRAQYERKGRKKRRTRSKSGMGR